MNTSQQLHQAGQSIWYDNVERRLLNNCELASMIAREEIRGVTSNPTIFMNAVTKSSDYDTGLVPLAKAGKTGEEIFWELAIEAGINVNVTLIFSRERYWAVMEMYLSGLNRRVAKGLPIDSIASAASFFVPRVDTMVDSPLMGMIDRGSFRAEKAAQFLGQAAIANAR